MNDLINIGIIIGGRSVESEISLISGSQAYLNLDNTKYNKIIFYRLYGQSEHFAYSDGLITKSNINNIYSFGKLVLENQEINEKDIYYIEVKCGETRVFGGGSQHFYSNNGMLFIEENGYNEILSPYKLENLDKWRKG